MNNQKMGQFIAELRKSKQMTQKELAAKLDITDKAVSKWERGLCCPDISLLSTIAELLGVTISELLNGEKNNCATENIEASIDNALLYADKTAESRVQSLQNICSIAFSGLLLAGILVCVICDIAISGTFTWSLLPTASIVFAWLTLFPFIRFGEKGIWGAMIALSVLLIPFLYVLNLLINTTDLIMPIGIRVSVISIVYLWCVFALFKILKTRKLLAGAIALLIAIPVYILINFSLSKIISESFIDVWDLISFSIIAIAAIILFTLDHTARKK